jgi:HEAT repeat protein
MTGTAGESFVKWTFERLGWGVATNSDSDLGTDLFVMARDERLFDLGLVIGVQVKTGPRWFRESARAPEGEVLGWWFRDDTRVHIDSWLKHGLPHLIVLHDANTQTSYWEHVRDDVVVSAGQGAKILVPRSQTLDDDHRDALLDVAATLRPRVGLEGSAWTGAASLRPRELLRHALVVPRLIAPHPNAGRSRPLTPEQAVALLAQARLRDFESFANAYPEVPSLTEAADSPDWSWRFVSAFGLRLTTGEIADLRGLIESAPTPAAQTAATVVTAAGLVQEARADEALALLRGTLEGDEAEPVDHAWLTMQVARACAELGQVDEARRHTYDIQQIRTTHSDDVTATAIVGVAVTLLFELAAWDEEDLPGLITGMDNAVAWWRIQTVSSGLTALTTRSFKSWARDRSIQFLGGERINNKLVAASLTAGHLGDHSAWRHLSGLVGQANLLAMDRTSDPDSMVARLHGLRLAGQHDALKLTVRRVADDGPATAVTHAAGDVDLEASTRTTVLADLALLRYGGDLLDKETATRTLHWLLATLRDPSPLVARTRPPGDLDNTLLEAIAAVVPAAPASEQQEVAEFLVTLPGQADQMLATSWARVLHAVPSEVWTRQMAVRLGQNAAEHHRALRLPISGLVSRNDAKVQGQLVQEALAGSREALAALGDVRDLKTDVAAALVKGLVARADQQARDAHGGQHGLGGSNVGRALTVLNVWHPDAADWDALLRLLGDSMVIGKHKREAFQVLTASADKLPGEIMQRLKTVAVAAAGQKPLGPIFPTKDAEGAAGAATELAIALGTLDEQISAEYLIELLAGSIDDRRWAARVAGRRAQPEDVGLLTSLIVDPDPAVRSSAASQLARMVAADQGGPLARQGLKVCLLDPGTLVPASVAATLEREPSLNREAIDALTQMITHPSARVRSAAAQGLARSTTNGRE